MAFLYTKACACAVLIETYPPSLVNVCYNYDFFSLPVMAICLFQHIATGSIVVVLRLPWTLLSPSTLTIKAAVCVFVHNKMTMAQYQTWYIAIICIHCNWLEI